MVVARTFLFIYTSVIGKGGAGKKFFLLKTVRESFVRASTVTVVVVSSSLYIGCCVWFLSCLVVPEKGCSLSLFSLHIKTVRVCVCMYLYVLYTLYIYIHLEYSATNAYASYKISEVIRLYKFSIQCHLRSLARLASLSGAPKKRQYNKDTTGELDIRIEELSTTV